MGDFRDFPLPDGSYSDATRPWTQQDVVNYLPTFAEQSGTRSRLKLACVPGLKPYAVVGDGPHRGAHDVEGRLFVVSGTTLYRVTAAGVAVSIGTIPGTSRVSMAHNQIAGGNELVIGTRDNSYVYNTAAGTLTATGVGLSSVDFLGQYILGLSTDRRFWRHSALADATTYSDLDVYSAESAPDRLVGGIVSQSEWLAFGERTVEVFTNSPTETAAFQRITGTAIEKGCANGNTVRRLDNSVFWLGNDLIVYRMQGYQPVPISTKAMTAAFRECDPAKAFAFTYEDNGYVIYYLTFQDGQTWGYDVTNQRWHRRESFGLDRWRLNTLVKSNGAWYGGDYSNGNLYKLEWGYMYEGQSAVIPRRIRSGVMHNNGNRVFVHGLKLLMDTGLEATTGVAFPEQPDGPSISGAAPDGSVGIAYAGYTYTVTEGDAAISSVTVVSGSLPAGLSMSNAGVIDTGTATTVGVSTFTIRVVDANGLWAELADTINITSASIAIGYNETPVNKYMVSSGSGTSWPGPGFAAGGQWPVGLSGSRFFVFNGTVSYYTDDFGDNVTAVELDANGGAHVGDYYDGVLLVPGSLSGIHRSTDEAESFTTSTTPMSSFVAMIEGLAVSVLYNETSKSDDKGETWTTGGTIPAATTVQAVAKSLTKIAFAGYDSDGPCAWITSDGDTYTRMTIPGTASARISGAGLKCGRVGDKDIWLAGTDESKVYWSDNDCESWTESDTEMDVSSMAFNGALFIIAGAIGTTPVIATTPDGRELTTRTHPYLEAVTEVASLPYE